jgi:GTP-binding protein YchF
METVDLELQVRDLDLVERKIEKTEKLLKTGDKDAKKNLEILHRYKAYFEEFKNARSIDLSEEEKKVVSELELLTAKPIVYVCNVDESSAVNGNKYVQAVKDALKDSDAEILIVAGAAEAEISELETIEEQMEFLKAIGLEQPGVNRLVRAAYKLLKLKSFFTIGPKEIRAWTIKEGMNAQQAAGVIHSDLERGFIRSEVIKYDDFMSLGSEHSCKEKGKLRLEGKSYIVEDGDLMHIRFNV